MLNQFSRAELIYGKEGMSRLFNAKVAVFGIGGVGGYTVEALARGGVHKLDLYDDDKICITNLNRQIHALHGNVGEYKTHAAKKRVLEINPNADVGTYNVFYTPETSNEVELTQYDYIIDAIDTISGKIELVVNAETHNIPIISSMGAGNKIDPTAFMVADIYGTSVCPLAKVMRHELRQRGIKKLKVVYSKEPVITPKEDAHNNCKYNCVCPPDAIRKCAIRRQIPGSNSYVPPVVGLIIAGEVIRDIIGCGRSTP